MMEIYDLDEDVNLKKKEKIAFLSFCEKVNFRRLNIGDFLGNYRVAQVGVRVAVQSISLKRCGLVRFIWETSHILHRRVRVSQVLHQSTKCPNVDIADASIHLACFVLPEAENKCHGSRQNTLEF